MISVKSLINRFRSGLYNRQTVKEYDRILKAKGVKPSKVKGLNKADKKKIIKSLLSRRDEVLRKAGKAGSNITKKKVINQQINRLNSARIGVGEVDMEFDDGDLIKLRKFGNITRYRADLKGRVRNLKTFYDDIIGMETAMHENTGETIRDVILYYKERESPENRVKHTAFSPDELLNFKEFSKAIKDQAAGRRKEGSEGTSEDEYELIFNHYDILVRDPDGGNGGVKTSKYYKTFKALNGGMACWKDSILQIRRDHEFVPGVDLGGLEELNNYISSHKLGIDVVGDALELKKECVKHLCNYHKSKRFIKCKNKNRTIFLMKLCNEDIAWKPLNRRKYGGRKKILYNYINRHYEVVDIEDCIDNLYISCRRDLYRMNKDGRYILLEKECKTYKNKGLYIPPDTPNVKVRYLFFDYETVINWDEDDVMIPYSLSILDLSEIELRTIVDYEDTNNVEMLNDLVKTRGKFMLSYDCTAELFEYMRVNGNNVVYKLISFNGSNFDNFILYNDLKKLNVDCLSKVQYIGTSLLDFRIYGTHSMFDLRRHLSSSLSQNCKSFSIKNFCKGEFDHNLAQEWYDNGELMKRMKENKKQIEEYNMMDVVSLAILFGKYKGALGKIKVLERYSKKLTDFKTIGTLVMDMIKVYWKRAGFDIGNYNRKEGCEQKRLIKIYNDLLKYKSGGRVQLFNGAKKIKGRMFSLDVCSLYAYVMLIMRVKYPVGKIIETKKPVKGKIGFYYCNIDQRPLKRKKLPAIVCKKEKDRNNWGNYQPLYGYLISTYKISLLKNYGAKVDVGSGFYFNDSVKSYEMFKPMMDLMAAKNAEDKKKADDYERRKKDPNAKITANPAMRALVKLALCAVSGKLIEGLHLETITETNYYSLLRLEKKIEKRVNIVNIDPSSITISYEKNQYDNMHKSKPIHLGILIYDLAQLFMYVSVLSKIPYEQLVYMDTDSIKLLFEAGKEWMEKYGCKTLVSHWEEVEEYDSRYKTHKLYEENSKVFGSFEDEYSPTNHLHYFLAKKEYLSLQSDNILDAKMSFKGVGKKDVILYQRDGRDYVKTPGGEKLVTGVSKKRLRGLYNESYKIENTCEELFETLYTCKKIRLLTASFTRNVRNQKASYVDDDIYDDGLLNLNNNTVQYNIRIKNIKSDN